jgi:hypothetical protein
MNQIREKCQPSFRYRVSVGVITSGTETTAAMDFAWVCFYTVPCMPPQQGKAPDPRLATIRALGEKRAKITVEQVRELIGLLSNFFCDHLVAAGFDPRKVRAVATKFRDAGRRSPPWRPASQKVPGRPQDGADGNRRPRWDFEPEHKFYADEITATLVEVRYYLQALSMLNAPPLPANTIQDTFLWLTGHRIAPGEYLDPLQLKPIDLKEFLKEPRSVVSGHVVPLDRGGRHKPDNAFLSLAQSNALQGSLTFEELLKLMEEIIAKQKSSDKAKKELLKQRP